MNSLRSPDYCEIRVEGVFDQRWTAWLGRVQVESEGAQTVISGLFADQPALHGLLAKIRDLGALPDLGAAAERR